MIPGGTASEGERENLTPPLSDKNGGSSVEAVAKLRKIARNSEASRESVETQGQISRSQRRHKYKKGTSLRRNWTQICRSREEGTIKPGDEQDGRDVRSGFLEQVSEDWRGVLWSKTLLG